MNPSTGARETSRRRSACGVARVPGRRAGASARDRCRRGPAVTGRAPDVPEMRLGDREVLPALPELRAEAEGAVHVVRPAARSALAAVPVLRGGGPEARGRGG